MAKATRILPLLLLFLFAGGCSSASTELSGRAVEFALRIERFLATDQVTELASEIDSYWADYRQGYSLHVRVADKPLAIAEAYLRKYQPGPLPRVFQTTYIYDRNGTQLAEIFEEGYRIWVSLDRISPHLIDAIIATEDASFFQNPGIDVRRVAGAFLQNAEAGEVVSGASTITMQLARYLFFPPSQRFEQSMERKTLEALLAQDLSTLYSKEEILEMYLNLVHFGQQAYGIEAASQIYFGKPATNLTLAEATLLAGVPQKPGEYDLGGNFDQVRERQRVVLNLMTRHGYLSAGDADTIFSQPIQILPKTRPSEPLAPHFVQFVVEQMNHRVGGVDVRRAGMRVFTTLDWRMQQLAQRIVSEQVEQLQGKYNLSNAALVALKRGTSEILAMVGSADFNNKEIAGQVNVAVRARQPGSAIKPVLYATAMDDLVISPATVIWDLATQYEISDRETYRPGNYDNEFHGPVTVRTALANSYNVPAVKLLDAIGVERMLASARALGIESLDRDEEWYGLSLTLGGGEVTLLDLTSAFHTLANAGEFVSPQSILFTVGDEAQETTAMGNVESVQAITPQTAFLITDILSDNDARLPAFGSDSLLRLSRPAAAKTGTTTDYRDNWTEGYTRYLVAGVWAGNSDGRPMRNVSGVTGAAPIWNAFMEGVLADPELVAMLGAPEDPDAWEFERPNGVTEVELDCPAGLVCREREYFTSEWMELTETSGPMGGSVMDGAVSTVYVDRGRGSQPLGACSQGGDVARRLLRLPFGIGRSSQVFDDESSGAGEALERTGALSEQRVRDLMAALLWSQDTSRPVYLGPCDQMEAVVSAMYTDTVQSIVVSEFTDLVAGVDDDAGSGLVLSAPIPPDAIPSSRYDLLGVAHDRNCSGTFVMGQVVNAQGQPIGGIRILYQDRLGNQTEMFSSRNAATYGSYKLPVLADSGHEIYISLANEAGEPLSDRAVVPHNQGGVTDLPCHYAIWRGVD